VQGTDYGANQAKKDAIKALFKVGSSAIPVETDALGELGDAALEGGTQKIVEAGGEKLAQKATGEDTGGAKGTARDLGTATAEGVLGNLGGELVGDAVEEVGVSRETLKNLMKSGGKMTGNALKRKLAGDDLREGAEDDVADEAGAVFAPD
jgi:hypothetical protein